MYILKIVLEGFKSFKSRTVLDKLDPKHNVIIGDNGSGKSNLFYAIQFVLSKEFATLNEKQRRALLHEGAGNKILNAYVAITFDNSDGRMPISHKEVEVRRVIGGKQDMMYLNGKHVVRSEIMELLEVIGFCQANPYFIVKQGNVNHMATDSDASRLELLQTIAGCQAYEDRQVKALESLEMSNFKIEVCEKELAEIETRLTVLIEEKERLRHYQDLENQCTCIDYVLQKRKVDELDTKLKELYSFKNDIVKKLKCAEREAGYATVCYQNVKSELKQSTKEKRELEYDQVRLQKVYEEMCAKRANYEFSMDDYKKEIDVESEDSSKQTNVIIKLASDISKIESEIAQLNPEFEKLMKTERQYDKALRLLEQQQDYLYKKQNRSNEFGSIQERNVWIDSELENVNHMINEVDTQINNIKNEMDTNGNTYESYKKEHDVLLSARDDELRHIEDNTAQIFSCKKQLFECQSKKWALWKKEDKLKKEQEVLVENHRRAQWLFRKKMPKALAQGWDSVNKVLETFKIQGNSDITDAYFGLVIENISCRTVFRIPVEAVAGNRLYHHIANDAKTVTKIIIEMNRQSLPGEVSFITVNSPQVDVDWRHTTDFISLVSIIDHDERMQSVISRIFGNALVVRNDELLSEVSRKLNMDCVTVEGSLVRANGVMYGGYSSSNDCHMTLFEAVKETKNLILAKTIELQKVDKKLEGIKDLTMCYTNRIEISNNENQKRRNTITSLEKYIRETGLFIKKIENGQQIFLSSRVEEHTARFEVFKKEKINLENERNEQFQTELKDDDQQALNNANTQIVVIRKIQKQVLNKSKSMHERLGELNCLLDSKSLQKEKLQRTSSELVHNLKSKTIGLNNLRCLYKELCKEQADVQSEIKEIDRKWQIAVSKVADLLVCHDNSMEVKVICDGKKTHLAEQINCINSELYFTKSEYKDELKLDVDIPAGYTVDQFVAMSSHELQKEHEKLKKKIKLEQVTVNLKSQYQYNMHHALKLAKNQHYTSLLEDRSSLIEFLSDVDVGKESMVHYMFRELSRYFDKIFKYIVPTGKCSLVMQLGQQGSDAAETTIIGIGIQAQFFGNNPVPIHLLSGGEKSLVALALIFAIQKCCPAPFYLFDEIDQALSTTYRQNVANLIKKISECSQVITTTFRPELLSAADKCYRVTYSNSSSHVCAIDESQAPPSLCEDTRIPDLNLVYAAQTSAAAVDSSETAAPVSEPVAPVSEPVAPASEPLAPASEPVAPASEPVAPASEPVAPASEPVAPASEPVAPVSEPVAPISGPASSE